MTFVLRTSALLPWLATPLLGGCSSSQGGERPTGPGGTAAARVAHRATAIVYTETASAPAGTTVGDLLVAGVIGQGLTGAPAGWSPIGAITRCGPAAFEHQVYYCWRIRQAADATYSFRGAVAVQIAVYAGTDAAQPIGAFNLARHDGTAFELGTLTGDAGDAAHYQSLGVFHGVFTPPAGYTERQDGADATTAGDRLELGAGQSTGGSVRCTDAAERPLTDDGVHLHAILRARRAN